MAITLLDIATANGSDGVAGLIDEAAKAHPEVRIGAARTIAGLNYRTLVRTAVPSLAFRAAGEGAALVEGTFESRLFETFILEAPIEADKAICDRYEDGPLAYLALHGAAILEAGLQTIAKCFYYGTGTGGDAKAFPGLLQAYDSTNMVIDAGGTTPDTGSSVWAVRFGLQDVVWVYGNDGAMEMTDVETVRLTDGSGNTYQGYRTVLGPVYPGLQVASIYSIGRIKKLTEDSAKGLTDLLLDKLLEKFPAGKPPNALFMTRRSRRQLKNSRTATTPTGKTAEWPDSIDGPEGPIPIHTTDAILNTEALTL